MRILHVGTACFYTEGMAYQDNLLMAQNVKDGHTVVFVSNCAKYADGVVVYAPPEDKPLEGGGRLVRLPFVNFFGEYVSAKIRKTDGLYDFIVKFNPDVILHHGLCAWDLLIVARYKRNHHSVKFYADCHEDFGNSAKNFFSKYFLHKVFYRIVLRKAYPQIEKIFLINLENEDFIKGLYGLPGDKMEYISPGGLIPVEDERRIARQKIREAYNLLSEHILILHSGKLNRNKRTEELLRAFASVKNPMFRMIILGSMTSDVEPVVLSLIKADERVSYLGWKPANELIEYLCACDLYAQPGSQSATMNTAMCCGAPVMLHPRKNHMPFLNENGWFVEDEKDIVNALNEISETPQILKQMGRNSIKIAHEILDYKKIAAKLYE